MEFCIGLHGSKVNLVIPEFPLFPTAISPLALAVDTKGAAWFDRLFQAHIRVLHVSIRGHVVCTLDGHNCRNQADLKFWHSETVFVTHLRSPSRFSEQLNWRFWDMKWTLGASQRNNGSVCAHAGVSSFKSWMLGFLTFLCQRKKLQGRRTSSLSLMRAVPQRVPTAAKVDRSAPFPLACANKTGDAS